MCRRNGKRCFISPEVYLARLAYDKYQERKERKAAENVQMLPSPEVAIPMVDKASLKKADIPPPSYNDVVINRAESTQPQVHLDEKAMDLKDVKEAIYDIDRSISEDRAYGVANGMNYPQAAASYAEPSTGAYSSGRLRKKGCCGSSYQPQLDSCQSRCEQKRAAKAARKAEKQAAKAAAREMRV